mgnify:CR=1 FL=1
MFHVVTGGSGSGKSAYAEEQICMLKKRQIPVICIILQPWSYGKETEQKILRHRQNAKWKGFETLECLQILRSWCRPSRVSRGCDRRGNLCTSGMYVEI